MWVVLVWILCMLLAGFIAGMKQRSALWSLLGLALGPFGVIIVALLPNASPAEQGETYIDASGSISVRSNQRLCPFCAETIKAAAVVCKHCGRDVPPLKPEAVITESALDAFAGARRAERKDQ